MSRADGAFASDTASSSTCCALNADRRREQEWIASDPRYLGPASDGPAVVYSDDSSGAMLPAGWGPGQARASMTRRVCVYVACG